MINKKEVEEFCIKWRNYNYDKVNEISKEINDPKIRATLSLGIVYLMDFLEFVIFSKFGGRK